MARALTIVACIPKAVYKHLVRFDVPHSKAVSINVYDLFMIMIMQHSTT